MYILREFCKIDKIKDPKMRLAAMSTHMTKKNSDYFVLGTETDIIIFSFPLYRVYRLSIPVHRFDKLAETISGCLLCTCASSTFKQPSTKRMHQFEIFIEVLGSRAPALIVIAAAAELPISQKCLHKTNTRKIS